MANDYDKIFKENIEAIYLAFSRRFIKNDFEKTEELSTDIQKTNEKKTDFLRKLLFSNSKDNFILHIEIQSKDDYNMVYRMQEYHAVLVRKYKMKVVQLVFYFGKGISRMQHTYHDGRNHFSFELVSIQQYSYRTFLETDKPEELILAILADFEKLGKEEIAKLIFDRAKVITNETFSMEKFVNQIEVLSKLRNLDDFIQQFILENMALDLKMEDTFTFKEGKKEGKMEGKMEKQDKMILAFLKKGKFSHEDIAEAAEVSLDYVQKLAEKLIKK
jgi:hypothetical protein